MGLTMQEAQSIGLGHLHPGVTRDRSAEQELVERYYGAPKPKTKAVDDGLNKLERRFRDDVLEPACTRHAIVRYWREPTKFRLAGRTWYTPDWLVMERSGEHGLPSRLVFVETKGFMRDDASVKLKVAASMYPAFGWYLVTRDKWGWDVREVGMNGIGRDSIVVPWLNGGA